MTVKRQLKTLRSPSSSKHSGEVPFQLHSSCRKFRFVEPQHTLVTKRDYLRLPRSKSLKHHQSRNYPPFVQIFLRTKNTVNRVELLIKNKKGKKRKTKGVYINKMLMLFLKHLAYSLTISVTLGKFLDCLNFALEIFKRTFRVALRIE